MLFLGGNVALGGGGTLDSHDFWLKKRPPHRLPWDRLLSQFEVLHLGLAV